MGGIPALVWEKVAGIAGAAAGGCEAMELRKARFFNGALPLKKLPRKKNRSSEHNVSRTPVRSLSRASERVYQLIYKLTLI